MSSRRSWRTRSRRKLCSNPMEMEKCRKRLLNRFLTAFMAPSLSCRSRFRVTLLRKSCPLPIERASMANWWIARSQVRVFSA
jgi:hypothetical protein